MLDAIGLKISSLSVTGKSKLLVPLVLAILLNSWGQPAVNMATLNGRDGIRVDGAPATVLGTSVAGAGDVNGDGVADYIISTPSTSFSANGAGSTYVLFGKPAIAPSFTVSSLNGTNGFRVDGEKAFDRSGTSISGAGDFNGDGFDDIVIGAPGNEQDFSYPGNAYVLYGSTAGFTSLNLSAINGSNGVRIVGESGQDATGNVVAGGGDINGDGFADVIIGSRSVPGAISGKCYVVFGNNSAAATLNLSSLDGTNGVVFVSPNLADGFAAKVSNAGDINGDGFDDVIIGAHATNFSTSATGSTYVVFGRANWPTSSTKNLASLNGIDGFRIDGQRGTFSGISISSAGDFNGDGFSDILVGAENPDSTAPDAGSCFLIFGKNDWSSSPVVSLDALPPDSGIRFNSDARGAAFAVAGLNDMNGDGLDDILITAPLATTGIGQEGIVQIVYGSKSSPAVVSLSSLNGTNGFSLLGTTASDFFGASGSGAGDVNQDGFADCIVSAVGADYNGTGSGAAYLFYGGPGPKFTYTGTSPAGNSPGRPLDTHDSRVLLDFDSGTASIETVHITLSRAEIRNLEPLNNIAPIIWNISTNRTGWASCRITFNYTNAEITGITGGETSLVIYNGQTPSGPWTPLVTSRNAGRNEVSAITTQLGFFAIGGPTTLNTSAETPWDQYP